MSLYTTPLLYLNMGGEMLYVLQQRLKAQRIDSRKSAQVMDDITAALLNPKVLSTVFDPSPRTGVPCIRSTLECVALSSIMRLDKDSMNKLFDLMIMMVKYQLTMATGPREVILLTLNHTDSMRNLVTDECAHECVSLVHQMMVDVYSNLTMGQVWQARNDCLKELAGYNIRVSILLRLGLQNSDATFNYKKPEYDENYSEHQDILKDLKINGKDCEQCNFGTFELYGNRVTLLGKNMYSSSYAKIEKPKPKEQQFLNDYGTGGELRMLAVQLGTDDSISNEKAFTLNMFNDVDDESFNNNNNSIDSGSSNLKETKSIKREGPKGNEEYKKKLDSIYADFFEDDTTEVEHNMDLLELLDEIE